MTKPTVETLRPIDYEEYHRAFADHLMSDVDDPPQMRVVQVEYYDRDTKWFECSTQFNLTELAEFNGIIREVTIS